MADRRLLKRHFHKSFVKMSAMAWRGSVTFMSFHLLCHTVDLALSTHLCYHSDEFDFYVFALMH